MHITPINNSLAIKGQRKETSELYSRLATMGIGMAVGTTGALLCLKNKNYSSKKLWINSLEVGAALGLCADIAMQLVNMPKRVKEHQLAKNLKDIDIENFKNKDFFINLYTGNRNDLENFEKYENVLANKEFCERLFQDNDVLKASQKALLEINYKKIEEAKNNNDLETIKDLEILNKLLEKNTKNAPQSPANSNYLTFKGLFDFFHTNGEPLKKQAEITVNRYASSAAAAAAALANTGIGDSAALTIITKNMCKKIFKIYNCYGGYTAAIGAASAGAVAGTLLLSKATTIWPGAGNALNATITYSLHQLEGRALIEFLEESSDNLSGMSDVDAIMKYAYKIKLQLAFIENDKVREYAERAVDKAFDIFL